MRVLGIDPGTAVTGYGVVESAPGSRARLIECGVFRTASADPLATRLRSIHDDLAALLARLRPEQVAVEGLFLAKNVRTTVVLGHARGVILLAAAEAELPVTEYSPALVKKTIVGRGAALKPQVGFMVAQLLRLTSAPRPADAADAVAIALTHLMLGQPRASRPVFGGLR
ncbi:MAG: crossover junction endodeoxyribonuclease RuvC [Gemmatimonadota bacterium]